MAAIASVDDTTFKADVLESTVPVMVDFWAPWCGPCRQIAPLVDELSEEYAGKVKFVKLNTDDAPRTPGGLGIMGIPTLIVFKGGKEVSRVVGFQPKGNLRKAIDKALA
jgi:thioredoxin 1